MGGSKMKPVEEVKKNETFQQNQKEHQLGKQASSAWQAGLNLSEAQRRSRQTQEQQRQAQERQRQEQLRRSQQLGQLKSNVAGTTDTTGLTRGTTTGTTRGSTTGTTRQTGTTGTNTNQNTIANMNQLANQLQNTSNNTGYQFQWVNKPMWAEMQALKDWKGGIDPTMSFRYAADLERMSRYGQNPYGAATPESLRQSQLAQMQNERSQQYGQEAVQQAFNQGQLDLGRLTNIAGQMAPIREMMGQTQTGQMTGQTGTTGQTQTGTTGTSQTTQDLTTQMDQQTLQEMEQQQLQETQQRQQMAQQTVQDTLQISDEQMSSMTVNDMVEQLMSKGMSEEEATQTAFDLGLSEEEGTREQWGESEAAGSSTGTQTRSEPKNFWGDMFGTAAGAALAIF